MRSGVNEDHLSYFELAGRLAGLAVRWEREGKAAAHKSNRGGWQSLPTALDGGGLSSSETAPNTAGPYPLHFPAAQAPYPRNRTRRACRCSWTTSTSHAWLVIRGSTRASRRRSKPSAQPSREFCHATTWPMAENPPGARSFTSRGFFGGSLLRPGGGWPDPQELTELPSAFEI